MNARNHGEVVGLELSDVGEERRPGYRVLAGLLRHGVTAIESMKSVPFGRDRAHVAYGRIRGTGPGVSFTRLVQELESVLPRTLAYPFEGSDRVGGAVWTGDLLSSPLPNSLAKLRWEPGADDLPMHVHEHSDRCIIVLEGRGFFHTSEEPLSRFTGDRVRTIAARERDVFVFRRGVVHTFSTIDHPMTLLSVQMPFLPFDDPRQYTLPAFRWTARDHLPALEGRITHQWIYLTAAGG